MLDQPPELLIVQTHSHRVLDCLELIGRLATRCELRVHVSIETDRESLPGLPPHASSVERRFEAAARLKQEGIRTVVTVSPLLPIADPERFFARIAACAHAVVLDHFIQGDGSSDGGRTLRTNLPAAMSAIDPPSVALAYRDAMVEIARRHLPQATGVNIDGFAGRFLPA
jgi:DNA repair photolyase